MRIKRFLCIALSFILLFGIVGTAGATQLQEKVVFQAAEITDENLIQERMDKGITDDSSIKVSADVSGDVFTDDSGQKWKVVAADVKYTSQKLKEVILGTQRQQDFVVHSSVEALIVPYDYGNNIPINDTDGGSTSMAQLDQTSYMSFEDDITANPGGYTGGTATKFHSTKAKITKNESTAELISLRVGQHGEGLSSTTKTGTYDYRFPDDDLRNISRPSNGTYYSVTANKTNYWWWIKPGQAPSATIGGFAGATVKRGTQTYNYSTSIYRSL